MLITQRLVYYSDTQKLGLNLSFVNCQVAWTLLLWTFMRPLDKRSTAQEVFASCIKDATSGVRQAYERCQQQLMQTCKVGAQRPAVVLHAGATADSCIAVASDKGAVAKEHAHVLRRLQKP